MRKEITYQQALIQREKLQDELRSEAHNIKTETLVYGDYDPFVVDAPRCDSCGSDPIEEGVGTEIVRWQLRCPGCNKTIQHPQRHLWQARLLWCERNLGNLNYTDLPLFDLQDLPPPMARRRMSGIRRDLELRKSLAQMEAIIALEEQSRAPGKLYRKKLDAYLRWAMLSLRLIKHAESKLATVPLTEPET